MMLGSLDNEVIFKKAFTDEIVLEAFIKDILGIEMKVGKIETEKKFSPPIGYIDFELDVFAESVDKRIAVELQRAQYDYNFDRFMHYLQMLVSEQQKNARNYKVKQTVYMIVIMTLPYKFNDLTGEAVKEEFILTKFSSQNLQGKDIPIYGHQMVCLNPNHPEEGTPQSIRDWLDLFYQSIHSPMRPSINWQHSAINRAAKLIDYEHLDPVQLRLAKDTEQAAIVRSMYVEEGMEKGLKEGIMQGLKDGVEKGAKNKSFEVAKKSILKGLDNDTIADLTDLSLEEIVKLREEII